MLECINLEKVLFPKKAERVDYFKAAVLYILADGKIQFIECDEKLNSDLEDPKIKAIIKEAVPGHNSVLLNLEIMCNVNQHIIDDDSITLNTKIKKIARYIKKFVNVG